MHRFFVLLAAFCSSMLPALAQSPRALESGAVYVLSPSQGEGETIFLFAVHADGMVGGDVLSAEADLLCPEAWSAQAQEAEGQLRFDDIRIVTSAPCAEALQRFAQDLAQVRSERATDEGILLLDGAGETLFRLTIGG